MKYITNSREETYLLGFSFGARVKKGDVIAFTGGIGMGKTTFVRGMAKAMGYKGDVHSPTFALVNVYESSDTTLYHFDMYRITTLDDLFSTGFYDYLDEDDAVFAIEWSENISSELPENIINISIVSEIQDYISEKRFIEIKGDERFENLSY